MQNINIVENIGIQDNLIDLKKFKGTIISGHMDIIDNFGNKILDKDNLVVLQGRGFILQKLFNCSTGDSGLVKSILGGNNTDINVTSDTIPLLLSFGSSGVSVTGDSIVKTPNYNDILFNKPITLTNNVGSNFSEGNLSGKKFDKIKYVNDSDNNECYVVLELSLSGSDLNNSGSISEAGLLAGDPVYNEEGVLVSVSNLFLISHITFNTIPLNNNDKITIRYYLYA